MVSLNIDKPDIIMNPWPESFKSWKPIQTSSLAARVTNIIHVFDLAKPKAKYWQTLEFTWTLQIIALLHYHLLGTWLTIFFFIEVAGETEVWLHKAAGWSLSTLNYAVGYGPSCTQHLLHLHLNNECSPCSSGEERDDWITWDLDVERWAKLPQDRGSISKQATAPIYTLSPSGNVKLT